MKSPRRFLVPVGWNQNGLRSPEEHLSSHTEVLSVPSAMDMKFTVERIPGSWSPHIPEKKPRYRITYGSSDWSPKIEVEPVRLGQLGHFNTFLVLRPTQRVQRCLVYHGFRHALVMGSLASLKLRTFCGESPYLRREDEAEAFVPGIPDCPECLTMKQGWVFYYAYPYEDKRANKKVGQRAKTLMKRREKHPTAFDRILLDDPLDPPPKPPKERLEAPLPDVETDFERAHREAKLRARRDEAEYFKQAKRRARKQ